MKKGNDCYLVDVGGQVLPEPIIHKCISQPNMATQRVATTYCKPKEVAL